MVFTQRLKRSGMSWTISGGPVILELRVIGFSGIWHDVHHVHQRYLAATPMPSPHMDMAQGTQREQQAAELMGVKRSHPSGTGSRCRWTPRCYCSRVTPPPRADNPGPLVRCDRTQKYSGVPSGPGPDRHSHESRIGGPLRHNSLAGEL